ncbi:chemotaxis protein CheW [Bacillus sp. CGMCC 1.16607]|uniref:chemotaxis protein CheW n=1 Tax=Bacillus sp. CGMCC 1.16607 TaxID=3351842 RepID=UPI00363D1A83
MKNAKVLIFTLGREEFALEVKYISSIEPYYDITNIPGVSSMMLGVISLRGLVTPIIDLKQLLNIEVNEKRKVEDQKILVTNKDNEIIGYLIDVASDVIDINRTDIQPTPEIFKQKNESYVQGIFKINGRIIKILNSNCLLGTIGKKSENNYC